MEETTKAEQASGHGPSLEVTAQRLARWREVRRRGERIPPALWAAAVELAEAYGARHVADVLHLDLERLGRRMKREADAAPVGEADPRFVELIKPATLGPATAADVRECVIDLHNAHGATMRVELAGGGLAVLADLCKAFCGAR
jgi:hypothetical protein